MTPSMIDPYALQIPKDSGLPPCLYVPIAAKDQAAIERHVGSIVRAVGSGPPNQALLVACHAPSRRDASLPIWTHENSGVLHCAKQVWVHVDFGAYRRAYKASFPSEDLSGLVIDHVMNRRVARVKGFAYVRLVAISRGANSSSGGLCEKWQVAYHSSEQMREINSKLRASIQYADLADLVKMLDMKTGNSIQDGVNRAQVLVRPAERNTVPGTM
jgi:hypothetical protein